MKVGYTIKRHNDLRNTEAAFDPKQRTRRPIQPRLWSAGLLDWPREDIVDCSGALSYKNVA